MTATDRLGVPKTLKLYLDGAFVRSESGRTSVHVAADGSSFRVARGSRKDVRDAVRAARRASAPWAARDAYQRGQILYRVAEIMESRRVALVAEVASAGRRTASGPDADVDAAIDCWVHYAGWTDKLAHVAGGMNPVAGPFFNISIPEPVGVVGIVAPAAPGLAGLVARLAPALCGGNVIVAIASETAPATAVALAECLAVADVAPGVVNVLTGTQDELVPALAAHLDIDALDLAGASDDVIGPAETACAEGVTRVVGRHPIKGLEAVTALLEIKTVWHPKGR